MTFSIRSIKCLQLPTFLGLLLLSGCFRASSTEQQVTSKEGNFTVLMPGPVKEKVETSQPAPDFRFTTRNWSTIKNESVYVVSLTTFPQSAASRKAEPFLQKLVQFAKESSFVKGKQVSLSSLSKGGAQCKDFLLTGKPSPDLQKELATEGLNLKDKTVFRRAILCLKGPHAIEALLITPSSKELETNGAAFFKSLNIQQ